MAKSRPNFKVKVTKSKFSLQQKDLATRNVHVKFKKLYLFLIESYGLKANTKVKKLGHASRNAHVK